MYDYLAGKLVEKTPTAVILDVGGVGYRVLISVTTYSALPSPGQDVRLLTHFLVREDMQALYGFHSQEERRLFRLLISISGIGPKMAMTILSGMSIAELKQAIVQGDLQVLTRVSGIGRKTAERMVVELREKLVIDGEQVPVLVAGSEKMENSLIEDSLSALMELGYRKQNAKTAIEKVLKDPDADRLSISDLIRASLKYV